MAETNMTENNYVISDSVQIAPIRSLDEFLLGKARFQMPTFNDLPKWNNRIVTNLLYYQTNYFALALVFALFSCFIHAKDVLIGISAIGLLVGLLLAGLSKHPQLVSTRKERPYVFLVAVAIVGYYVIYFLPSVIVLLVIFTVPLLIIFTHASFRMRNLASKIQEQVEKRNLRQTLMGQFLDLINLSIRE